MVIQNNTDTKLKKLSIKDKDVEDAIKPYVLSKFSKFSKKGNFLLRQRNKNLIHLIILLYLKQLKLFKREKKNIDVIKNYENSYSNAPFVGYAIKGKYITYLYKNNVYKLDVNGTFLLQCLILEKIFNIINPISICEIGCGSGRHLLNFCRKFANISFNGIDVSSVAIKKANEMKASKKLNLHFPNNESFLSKNEIKLTKNINFFCRDAKDLYEIEDNKFEVIYSICALEQMHDILPIVLKELHRVTKNYVIFIEPFSDKNNLLSNQFLFAGNYFRIKSKFLEKYGFKILNHLDNIPLKPTFNYSVVIGKIVNK